MEIVNFSDIYDTFMKNLKRKMIIPIIGSGFTLNSEAKKWKSSVRKRLSRTYD